MSWSDRSPGESPRPVGVLPRLLSSCRTLGKSFPLYGLYWLAWAPMTECHKRTLAGFEPMCIASRCWVPGAWRPGVGRPAPAETCGEQLCFRVPVSGSSRRSLACGSGAPGFTWHHVASPVLFTRSSPMHACLCVQISPFLKDTCHVGWWLILMSLF